MKQLVLLFSTLIVATSLLFSKVEAQEKDALVYPIGDVRNCAGLRAQGGDTSKPLIRMDVLPGLGFDNLRNLDLGQVLDFNYSTCQVSGDGLYLLPDNVYLIPIQQSKVDVFAEYFNTFQDHKSLTAVSVNTQFKYSGMFSSIGGSFSTDYQDTKSKMVNHNSNSARVSLRYKLYTAHIPSDAQLHRGFKSRLLDIAANIQNNNTKLAHYLAETLVRDYGTHAITSVDAGAGLSQTTFIAQDFLKDQTGRSLVISASASGSFLGSFSASGGIKTSVSSSDIDAFNKHTTNSHVLTYGGPMFRIGNFSLTDWENGVADHLVAIDRSGVPLYSVINTNNVPELPDSTLLTVMDYVYKAVTKYYKVNTIVGCMEPSSSNFNFQANADDKSCTAERMNYTFGGIYQTCTFNQKNFNDDLCESASQTNPLTQNYSCPEQYQPILLHTGTISSKQKDRSCKKHCAFLGLFCHDNCWTYELVNSATYHAYWCAHNPDMTVPPDSGMMFGGVYTSKQTNQITGARSCPPYYYPLHFGEDIWVCVSSDANGEEYNVPFGGFDSCTNGNPLAASANQSKDRIYPHRCGKHYSQFLVTIDEGCEINYCADIIAIKKQQPHPPRLPPYHALPRMSLNVTNILVVRGTNGKVWIKTGDGIWQEYTDNQQTSQDYLKTLAQEAAGPSSPNGGDNMNNDNGSVGVIIGVAIGSVASTILVGALIALLVFGIRKAKSASKSRSLKQADRASSSSRSYLVINDEHSSTTASNSAV